MTKKKHEELVEEIKQIIDGCVWTRLEWEDVAPEDIPLRGVESGIDKRDIEPIIAFILSAFRDGKVEILCPECNEPIKVLKCECCHLDNVAGYIVH